MRLFVSLFVLAGLWVAASSAQAQRQAGLIKTETCRTAGVKARSLIEGFYKSNKTDFPEFIEEQRQKTRDFGRDARVVGGTGMGFKGFLATAGAGKLLDMRFEKAVRILIENNRYETRTVFLSYSASLPKRRQTQLDQGSLWRLQDQFIDYCKRKM